MDKCDNSENERKDVSKVGVRFGAKRVTGKGLRCPGPARGWIDVEYDDSPGPLEALMERGWRKAPHPL